jgi:hypothetical protein
LLLFLLAPAAADTAVSKLIVWFDTNQKLKKQFFFGFLYEFFTPSP